MNQLPDNRSQGSTTDLRNHFEVDDATVDAELLDSMSRRMVLQKLVGNLGTISIISSTICRKFGGENSANGLADAAMMNSREQTIRTSRRPFCIRRVTTMLPPVGSMGTALTCSRLYSNTEVIFSPNICPVVQEGLLAFTNGPLPRHYP